MSVVVDASIALKWVLDEPDSVAAAALQSEELIAPILWLTEAANALWRYFRSGQITAEEADVRLSALTNAPVASFPVEPHLRSALRLATEIGHPVYDCLYLALAIAHDTHVVTADRRFLTAAQSPGLRGRVRPL
ncbi:MAG TPA: type II toxin-antitoxin system VapC family toxin, partial [Stellaceae bacterium]|nr:type II toxin-antitoxin system VapC family toxin [Stellaceae bacterium]